MQVQRIQVNDDTLEVIKIVDVSMMIKYWVANADKNVLEMANACVSHEMRNPINSINSMIIKMHDILEQMFVFLSTFNIQAINFKILRFCDQIK